MSLFGKLDLQEFATILRNATFAFGKGAPAPGWEALAMGDLGIDQFGTTFTTRNGRGKAVVVEQDGELMVAFRGTDKRNDFYDYDNISVSKNYYKQFEPLLRRVADYAEQNDLHVTFTGISLGGAVANMIGANSRKDWNRAFADSTFVGIASPYLSGDPRADIFNFGFNNDPIYHIVPGSWNSEEKANATNHVWVYENRRYLQGDNIDDRLSVHGIPKIADAVKALAGLETEAGGLLVDALPMRSYIVFDDTKEILKAGHVRHPWGTELVIIGEGGKDRIYGASENRAGSNVEWIYGRGGNDVIKAHGGPDKLFGGNGKDTLNGGRGADFMSGEGGDDTIYIQDHGDRALGGMGFDTFILRDILPVTGEGKPAAYGNHPARVYIDDFEPEVDVLNLRGIDGNLNVKGRQPLYISQYAKYDASDGRNDLEKGYVNDQGPGSVTIFEDQFGKTVVIVNMDSDRNREIEIILPGGLGDISNDILL